MSSSWQTRRAAARAAEWVARFDAGRVSEQERGAHQSWLAESPLHRREYAAAQRLFELAASLESPTALQASAVGGGEHVDRSRRRAIAWFATAAALCALVVGNFAFEPRPAAQVFTTALGERRDITLADGSVITLNTDSRVRLPAWDDSRRIIVERGEAFFAIAHDASRPFIAQAGAGSVRVLGTRFNVRLDEQYTTLAVLEGRVELSLTAQARSAAVRQVLAAGEGAAYDSEGTLWPVARPQLERITAWRAGKFVFSGTTLAEVVRELNRYSQRKVLIADRALGELRISGTFPTDRIESLLQALEKFVPVQAVTRGDTILLVAR